MVYPSLCVLLFARGFNLSSLLCCGVAFFCVFLLRLASTLCFSCFLGPFPRLYYVSSLTWASPLPGGFALLCVAILLRVPTLSGTFLAILFDWVCCLVRFAGLVRLSCSWGSHACLDIIVFSHVARVVCYFRLLACSVVLCVCAFLDFLTRSGSVLSKFVELRFAWDFCLRLLLSVLSFPSGCAIKFIDIVGVGSDFSLCHPVVENLSWLLSRLLPLLVWLTLSSKLFHGLGDLWPGMLLLSFPRGGARRMLFCSLHLVCALLFIAVTWLFWILGFVGRYCRFVAGALAWSCGGLPRCGPWISFGVCGSWSFLRGSRIVFLWISRLLRGFLFCVDSLLFCSGSFWGILLVSFNFAHRACCWSPSSLSALVLLGLLFRARSLEFAFVAVCSVPLRLAAVPVKFSWG